MPRRDVLADAAMQVLADKLAREWGIPVRVWPTIARDPLYGPPHVSFATLHDNTCPPNCLNPEHTGEQVTVIDVTPEHEETAIVKVPRV